MIELIEKAMLAGMGALSLTQQKTEELLSELKERFDLSEEKGKELLTRLQRAAEENQKKLEDLAREEVKSACDRMGMVTREEFEALQLKVEHLEKKLLEKKLKGTV